MLDMGFREDLERLLDATPATRRTLLFSATIPDGIAALARRYQKDALRIATQGEADRHRDIEYRAIPIVPRERDLAVVNVLRYYDAPGALVFCATRDGVTRLATNLAERGFSVAALSGELSQRERNVALQALRDGRARVCVATDVAARGLDLPDLGLVIHADLPQSAQVLVHRSGRTGGPGAAAWRSCWCRIRRGGTPSACCARRTSTRRGCAARRPTTSWCATASGWRSRSAGSPRRSRTTTARWRGHCSRTLPPRSWSPRWCGCGARRGRRPRS